MKYLYLLLIIAFSIPTGYGQDKPKIESITFIHRPPEGQGSTQKFEIRADGSNDFSSQKISLDRANAHIENHLKYGDYAKCHLNTPRTEQYDPRGKVSVQITLVGDDSTFYLLSDRYSEGEAVEIPTLRLFSESDQKLICKNLGTDCEAGALLSESMSEIGTKLYVVQIDKYGSSWYKNAKKGLVDAEDHIVLPVEYAYFKYVDFGAVEFTKDGITGVADLSGKIMMTDTNISVFEYLPGRIIAKKKNGVGVWDADGKSVIPDIYDMIEFMPWPTNDFADTVNRFFKATNGYRNKLFDYNGRLILDSVFNVQVFHDPDIIVYGTSARWGYGKVGAYDLDFNRILPITFDRIYVHDGYIVADKRIFDRKLGDYRHQYRAYDANGKLLLSHEYSDTTKLHQDLRLLENRH